VSAAPFAFITNNGLSSHDGSISVIDTGVQPNTLTTPIKLTGLNHPFGIAITPDGTKICVTEGQSVVIYDTVNNTVKTVPIINPAGKQVSPYGVAITNDGKKIYVTSPNPEPITTDFENGHYNAYEIDTTNNYAITPLPTSTASASPPYGIAVDSSGIVYVVYGY